MDGNNADNQPISEKMKKNLLTAALGLMCMAAMAQSEPIVTPIPGLMVMSLEQNYSTVKGYVSDETVYSVCIRAAGEDGMALPWGMTDTDKSITVTNGETSYVSDGNWGYRNAEVWCDFVSQPIEEEGCYEVIIPEGWITWESQGVTYTNSEAVMQEAIYIKMPGKVKAPVVRFDPGDSTQLIISCGVVGARVSYSITVGEGADAGVYSDTLYSNMYDCVYDWVAIPEGYPMGTPFVVEAYAFKNGWTDSNVTVFEGVVGGTVGISCTAEDSQARWFTMTGVEVDGSSLGSGTYIVVREGKSSKIQIR